MRNNIGRSSLLKGDCLEQLKNLPSETFSSLVSDPPAGIAFMGKDWDKDRGGRDAWVAWMTEVMQECLRVLKPGAHGLVWAIPRTSHWTMTALENAGFEVRDVVTHLFGTGFPKSLNLGEGRGTALKPACEFWVLVRKPCSEKTVAANVLKHGTGGLNIDGCRIGGGEVRTLTGGNAAGKELGGTGNSLHYGLREPSFTTQGRFPANLVLDEEAAAALDEQSGTLKSGAFKRKASNDYVDRPAGWSDGPRTEKDFGPANEGGASRFFYVAKASKADKGPDNSHPTVKSTTLMSYLIRLVTPPGGTVLDPFMGSGSTGVAAASEGMAFVGIEREEQYFETAAQRLKEVK